MKHADRRDSDLLGVWFAVWAACVVHLAFAIARDSAWGARTTITAFLVIWMPWTLRHTIAARWQRFRSR